MVIPGEWFLCDEPIEINVGRRTLQVSVRNTGDRPIQIGSHFHFFEVNRALDFDRLVTVGMRLDVPSGQSIRFEPGDERDVDLVEFGGMRRVIGFNGLLDGSTSARWSVARAIKRATALGFAGMPHPDWPAAPGRGEERETPASGDGPAETQRKDRQAVHQ